ncbi:transposase [Luteolibacter marinus]|uniref:transposase n=1 Tax=Luteolibacter marinus TaxID=2776705 RepID=UPI001866D7B9|nr:transposase [Luteolibacter marinus]
MYYDPDRKVDHHQRNLPHWHQDGTLSFLTFRLADSIPKAALAAWENERRIWLLHRLSSAEGDQHELLSQLNEVDRRNYIRRFGKQFHDLLDSGHGSCLLRIPDHSLIVESALRHFDGQRYQLGDFVVMPNHIHLLARPMSDFTTGNIVGSLKRFTAREINKLRGSEGTLWQHESFDHLVRDAGSFEGFRRYIRENPTKARLRPGEYRLGCGSLK